MASLLARLTKQVGSKNMAIGLLKKRHQMSSSGSLTKTGLKRQAMGAAGRAKDRASKASGHPVGAYHYDPRTNSATLKRK